MLGVVLAVLPPSSIREAVRVYVGVPLYVMVFLVLLTGGSHGPLGIRKDVYFLRDKFEVEDKMSVKKGCTWMYVLVTVSWILCITVCVLGTGVAYSIPYLLLAQSLFLIARISTFGVLVK